MVAPRSVMRLIINYTLGLNEKKSIYYEFFNEYINNYNCVSSRVLVVVKII